MNQEVKNKFLKYGVDVDVALQKMKEVVVSIHCWQLDDVQGFENDGPLTGGIQSTGNHPGKARNFKDCFWL